MQYAKVSGRSDVLTKTSSGKWLLTNNYPLEVNYRKSCVLNQETKELFVKKNLIPFPYYDDKVTTFGVEYVIREDGGLEMSGTPTASFNAWSIRVIYNDKPLVSNGKVTLSIQGDFTNAQIELLLYNESGSVIGTILTPNSTTFNMDDYPTATRWRISICDVKTKVEMSGIAYPQLEIGEIATIYQSPNFGNSTSIVELFGDSVNDINLDTTDIYLIDALIGLINDCTESNRRFLDYYPEVIKQILEFKAITESESYEMDYLRTSTDRVLNNSHLLTMDEGRIEQWENILGIKPLENSSVDDRRETVIARIRAQGKLNTSLINTIVNTFTGGTANSWIKDSVLYVEVTPPRKNKQYQFANVEQELSLKVPAHLGFHVSRNYYNWSEVKSNYVTWKDVTDNFTSWESVYIFSPFE